MCQIEIGLVLLKGCDDNYLVIVSTSIRIASL